MTPVVETPIDPFGPLVDGSYQDHLVTVTGQDRGRPAGSALVALTPHFEVAARGQHLWLRHSLRDDEIDEDLTGLLQNQLFEPGWVRGGDLFERLFTGVVRSVDPDPLRAWELYYRNTIRRIDALLVTPHLPGRPRVGSPISCPSTTTHSSASWAARWWRWVPVSVSCRCSRPAGACG